MPKTPRKTSSRRRKTYRQQGGDVASVEALIKNTPIGNVHIINPASRFVVVTYWWGKENMNRNLQNPCPEDIMEIARNRIIAEIGRESGFPKPIVDEQIRLEKITDRPLTRVEKEYYQNLKKQFKEWVTPKLAAIPDLRDRINAIVRQIEPGILARPDSVKPRGFPEMIAEWEDYCKKVGVNYVAVNTEFPRSDYQNAINGKPLFIKQALDAVKPRNVLYIDGDMWMLKYPHLFDLENVDFMARGWNVDPRTKEKAIQRPYFDPYTLETSGGTMYFGNTLAARELLDAWEEESNKQIGKADDRILSQVFTRDSMILKTNTIQLPIEYLWLTDAYDFQNTEDIVKDRIYIEHPACLTAEETARDQGAAASREPPNYEKVISDMIDCAQPGGVVYEYVFFTERRFVESFEPYLNYLRRSKNDKGEPFYKVVSFDEYYGKYNAVAYTNMELMNAVDVSTLPPTNELMKLPQDTTVPAILACFKNGNEVLIGDFKATYSGVYDLMAENIGDQTQSPYQRKIKVDIRKPMYMSGLNPVLVHLLMMCETLEDINKHYYESFLFASRIRSWWSKTDQASA